MKKVFSNKTDTQRTQHGKLKKILTILIIIFRTLEINNKILKPIKTKTSHKQISDTKMALDFSIATLEAWRGKPSQFWWNVIWNLELYTKTL